MAPPQVPSLTHCLGVGGGPGGHNCPMGSGPSPCYKVPPPRPAPLAAGGGCCCGNGLLPKRGAVTMATRCPRRKGGRLPWQRLPGTGMCWARQQLGRDRDGDRDGDTAPALPALLTPTLGVSHHQAPPALPAPEGESNRGAQPQPGWPSLWTLATCLGISGTPGMGLGQDAAHGRPLRPRHGMGALATPEPMAAGRDTVPGAAGSAPRPRAEDRYLWLSPSISSIFLAGKVAAGAVGGRTEPG